LDSLEGFPRERVAAALLAGACAEHALMGRVLKDGYVADAEILGHYFANAGRIAREKEVAGPQVEQLRPPILESARSTISDHLSTVRATATALLRIRRLTGPEVAAMVGNRAG
jgi:hypothetical protein